LPLSIALGIYNKNMSLVTIYTYNDIQPATLAKMKLESEGIEAHIHSSDMARMTGIATALGGLKIQVPINIAEKATEIINQFNKDLEIEK
jgi:hypothetical protein